MKRVVHKYDALARRILGEYGEYQMFAEDAKISRSALSQKLDGKSKINTAEMFEWCRLLNVSAMEIPLLFDINGTMPKVMSA